VNLCQNITSRFPGLNEAFCFGEDGTRPWRVRLRRTYPHAVLVWVVLLLGILIFEAAGLSPIIPQFGTPFIVGSNLIFAAPDPAPFRTHRLICISKRDGKKIWEKVDEKETISPCFVLNRQLIVVVGNEVRKCDPNSGELSLTYRTGFGFEQDGYVREQPDATMLVGGVRSNVDYLTLVDCNTWRALWEVPRISSILATGEGVVLCDHWGRVTDQSAGGYSLTEQSWVALSRTNGEVLWRRAPSSEVPVAVGHYFLVASNDTIQCLNQRDGRFIKQYELPPDKLQPDLLATVLLATTNQELLAWPIRSSSTPIDPKPAYLKLSVPELKARKFSKSGWQRALEDGFSAKDDACVYYSTIASNWLSTSMNRRDIKTGRSVELYKEALPAPRN